VLIIDKSSAGKTSASFERVVHGFLENNKFYKTIQEADVDVHGDEIEHINVIDIRDVIDLEDKDFSGDIRKLRFSGHIRKLKYINTIVIIVPTLDYKKSFDNKLRFFNDVFGSDFWKHAFFVFTELAMDSSSVKRRQEVNNGKDDEKLIFDYLQSIQKKFPCSVGFQYAIIHTKYEPEDKEEKKAFNDGMMKLGERIKDSPRLSTEQIGLGIGKGDRDATATNANISHNQPTKESLRQASSRRRSHLTDTDASSGDDYDAKRPKNVDTEFSHQKSDNYNNGSPYREEDDDQDDFNQHVDFV